MLLLLTAALLTADKLLLLYSFSVASHHFRWKLQTLALKLQRQRVVACGSVWLQVKENWLLLAFFTVLFFRFPALPFCSLKGANPL